MEVIYSPEVQQWTDGLPLLKQATARLAAILGAKSSPLVRAEWTRVHDYEDRTLYRLTIRDQTGEASTDFALNELQNALHMHFRLSRLWGDLLEIRSDIAHQRTQMLLAEMATDPEEN